MYRLRIVEQSSLYKMFSSEFQIKRYREFYKDLKSIGRKWDEYVLVGVRSEYDEGILKTLHELIGLVRSSIPIYGYPELKLTY